MVAGGCDMEELFPQLNHWEIERGGIADQKSLEQAGTGSVEEDWRGVAWGPRACHSGRAQACS